MKQIMIVQIACFITWAALLAGPVMGATLAWELRRKKSGELLRFSMGCIAFALAVAASYWIGIQTVSRIANFGFCLAAFLAYCFLASACWALKPRGFGISIGILAYASLVPVRILGTIGSLALLFIVGDYLTPPIHAESIAPGLSCEVLGWGAAISDEGYDVHVYRYPRWFPLVRSEVAKVRVDETDSGDGPANATCATVAARIR